jgi:sigma-B regulation protein RsbU (phosphoserine phosphatase)
VEIEVAPGDCLLFHTDGVKEAVDDHDGEFGMERLRESFRAHARLGAEAVIEGVQRDLKEFCGGAPQMDDVTLVAIERR